MPGDHKQKKKVKDIREKLGKAKKTNKLSKKIRKESMIQDVDEYYKEKKGKLQKRIAKVRKANEDYESRVENEIKNAVGQSQYTGVSGKDRVFKYLFGLQDSGITNMFNAGPYVKREFPELNNSQVKEVVSEWTKNYKSIHKRLGIGMKKGKIRKAEKFKIGPGDSYFGEINDYLFDLQESGQANMVTEAGGYLMRDFKLPRNEASAYMEHWMRNYKTLKNNRNIFNKTGVYPEGDEGIKYGKIRKADVSDINRVTRWDERTFNKNREMPKSKVKEEEDIEQVRTDMDLHPYQAIAKLRKRLAKVDDYKAESDPEAPPGEWLSEYKKKRKVRNKEK